MLLIPSVDEGAITIIEIRPYRGGWQCCEAPGVQLLTIGRLFDGTQRAEHTDYDPDLNFKKAKAERNAEHQSLI